MLSKLKYICALEDAGLLKEPVKRKYWVHPFHSNFEAREKFKTFFSNIRNYETKFFEYYRMSISSFDELLEIIRPHIAKQDTHWRNAVSAEERLTITLR